MTTILHVLTQRPSATGSGITLAALVARGAAHGWPQHVAVGVPEAEGVPSVGGLPSDHVHPLFFESEGLPFPVPGMSDVMPYRSTRFSAMTEVALDQYRHAWRDHLEGLVTALEPDLLVVNHAWIVGALASSLPSAPPVVVHSHMTGLRQLALCPHLADEVRAGLRGAARFLALHDDHARALVDALGVPAGAVRVVGAGFDEGIFSTGGGAPRREEDVVFVGKLSRAKGLPWLLDAVERLAVRRPGLRLHVVGSGSGEESTSLAQRMDALQGLVVRHGQLPQPALAELLRRASVMVLPSLYEGLPLVLVEAAACGCRLVATSLAPVVEVMAPRLGELLVVVPMPRLRGPDVPLPEDEEAFVAALEDGLDEALRRGPADAEARRRIGAFTWDAVFERVEAVWREVVGVSA